MRYLKKKCYFIGVDKNFGNYLLSEYPNKFKDTLLTTLFIPILNKKPFLFRLNVGKRNQVINFLNSKQTY